MTNTAEAFRSAAGHYQAGKLLEADQLCQQINNVDPYNADAWDLRGLIARAWGKPDLAVDFSQRAVRLCPEDAYFHNNLGTALHERGELSDAVASYRQAVKLKPDFAEPYHNLGNAFKEKGLLDEAVTCYRRAVQLKPGFADGHKHLGNALQQKESFEEAVASYRQSLELAPSSATFVLLGNAFMSLGRLDAAIAAYRNARQLNPDSASVNNNLGVALMQSGSNEEATVCFQRSLQLNSDSVDAHQNLGLVWKAQGLLERAVASFRQALQLEPESADVLVDLGSALKDLGRNQDALACYKRALQLDPNSARGHMNLGNVYLVQRRLQDALTFYRKALQQAPDKVLAHYNEGVCLDELDRKSEAIASMRQALKRQADFIPAAACLIHLLMQHCDWQDLESLTNRVLAAVDEGCQDVDPWRFLSSPSTAAQQLRCAEQSVSLQCQAAMRLVPELNFSFQRSSKPKIRLGYLSSDLRQHAVGILIVELIEKHNRELFDVLAYSHGPADDSPIAQRLQRAFDDFIDIRSLTYLDAARRIYEDEIDILIDLNGHTRGARMQILALRPAPIQANYLGYPGTMGAPFMDYIVVDDFVVPPEHAGYFSEEIAYLPCCYQSNDSRRQISPQIPTRSQCGLPEDAFVYCCFNNSFKIAPRMFDVWMSVLRAVPQSVLWLLEWNPSVADNLRKEAQLRGVAAERLVFGPRNYLEEHLARHQLADLLLDTTPYSGHTAGSDALWAGLPVLTVTGETFASRVAGSLLRSVDLPELITSSLEEYAELAIGLARAPERLAKLRERLSRTRLTSPLFDGGHTARHLENLYQQMWDLYRRGESPRTIRLEGH